MSSLLHSKTFFKTTASEAADNEIAYDRDHHQDQYDDIPHLIPAISIYFMV